MPVTNGARWVIAALVLSAVAGCRYGSEKAKNLQLQQSRLRVVVLLRNQFIARNGKPPADVAQFKQFVNSLPAEELQAHGIDNPEQVFVSERDGQLFGIVYGAPSGPPEMAGDAIVAYEQVGQGGKRFVITSLGATAELDDEGFRRLVPNAQTR